MALGAVERLGKDTSRRRLANPAWPGEQVTLRHAPGMQSIRQRRRDVLLTDDLVETLWAPFAGGYLVSHWLSQDAVDGLRTLRKNERKIGRAPIFDPLT